MTQQLFDVLEQHISLDEDQKVLIKNKFHVEKLRKGDVFIESGKVSRKVGFVLSGVLRYYFVDKFGKEITTKFIKQNEFALIIKSFYDLLPSNRTVEAEVNARVLSITQGNYQDIVEQIPGFDVAIGQITSNFLTQISERHRQYIDHQGAERYRLFLGHFPTRWNKVALGHVASFLGMSAPTLSRIRKSIKS